MRKKEIYLLEYILKGHSKKHVTNDDLNALKYLDITIKESLRLFPSVPVLTREFTEDCHIGKCLNDLAKL